MQLVSSSLRPLLAFSVATCLVACAGPSAQTPHTLEPAASAPSAVSPADSGAALSRRVPPPDPNRPYAERWYGNAVMYEVMVRSFYDSNGDGIGDLKGLTQKLDYLNTGDPASTTDLKVDALWLMPLFKAPSYHGYDATDYYSIDPVYGTDADFQTLITEAHKRGIRILLDLVLNHTSNLHPWFQRAAKSSDPNEKDWYVWGKSDPGWERPWGGGPVWHARGPVYYYGLFYDGMPDLNFRHPPVQDEMIKIARHWVEKGADGYRLDAIRYLFEESKGKQADLPETHAYLKRMAKEVKSIHPEAVLIGEVWTDTSIVASYYGQGDELDLCFNFDESGGLIGSVKSGNPQELVEALTIVEKQFAERAFSAPFLTNHDMPRLASLLEGNPAKLKLAAAVLLSLPGTPFLYQGEEIGLTQGPRPGDEGKRTPMQWDDSAGAGFSAPASEPGASARLPWNELSGNQAALSVSVQQGKPDSLLSWYQRMIRQRKDSSALSNGSIHGVARGKDAFGRVLTFQRAAKGELIVAAFNFGNEAVGPQKVMLDSEALKAAGLGTSLSIPVVLADSSGKPAPQVLVSKPTDAQPTPEQSVEIPALPPQGVAWIRVQAAQK